MPILISKQTMPAASWRLVVCCFAAGSKLHDISTQQWCVRLHSTKISTNNAGSRCAD